MGRITSTIRTGDGRQIEPDTLEAWRQFGLFQERLRELLDDARIVVPDHLRDHLAARSRDLLEVFGDARAVTARADQLLGLEDFAGDEQQALAEGIREREFQLGGPLRDRR